eukprot:31268-Pelagococcus_subviridis.AAC.10
MTARRAGRRLTRTPTARGGAKRTRRGRAVCMQLENRTKTRQLENSKTRRDRRGSRELGGIWSNITP